MIDCKISCLRYIFLSSIPIFEESMQKVCVHQPLYWYGNCLLPKKRYWHQHQKLHASQALTWTHFSHLSHHISSKITSLWLTSPSRVSSYAFSVKSSYKSSRQWLESTSLLLGHLNRTEPSLRLLVTPVPSLQRLLKLSAAKTPVVHSVEMLFYKLRAVLLFYLHGLLT